MRVLLSAVPLVLLAACSSTPEAAQPAPAALDPVGMYDFTATFGPETAQGTLEIERTAAGLDAEAWVDAEPEPALGDSIRVTGSHVVIYGQAAGDPLVFELDFQGNTAFSGVIHLSNPDAPTISLTGTRRAP